MSSPPWDQAVPLEFTHTYKLHDQTGGEITVRDFPEFALFADRFLWTGAQGPRRYGSILTYDHDSGIVSIRVSNGWCRYRVVDYCVSMCTSLGERLGPLLH